MNISIKAVFESNPFIKKVRVITDLGTGSNDGNYGFWTNYRREGLITYSTSSEFEYCCACGRFSNENCCRTWNEETGEWSQEKIYERWEDSTYVDIAENSLPVSDEFGTIEVVLGSIPQEEEA